MRKLKEENKKARDADKENAKRVANLEKTARKKDNEIRLLKMKAAHNTENLKRKQEEVQRLREKQRKVEMSTDVRARRTTMFNFDPQIHSTAKQQYNYATPVNAAAVKRKAHRQIDLNDTVIASPARAKKQWDAIEKMVSSSFDHVGKAVV